MSTNETIGPSGTGTERVVNVILQQLQPRPCSIHCIHPEVVKSSCQLAMSAAVAA